MLSKNLESIIPQLEELTRGLFPEILKIYRNPKSTARAKKDGSPVTKADMYAHKMIVRFLGKNFSNITIEKRTYVKVGAAFNCIKLARNLAVSGIKGLEFFSGIPGTIGGAIKMNAGAYNSQTSDRLVSVSSIDKDGSCLLYTSDAADE